MNPYHYDRTSVVFTVVGAIKRLGEGSGNKQQNWASAHLARTSAGLAMKPVSGIRRSL